MKNNEQQIKTEVLLLELLLILSAILFFISLSIKFYWVSFSSLLILSILLGQIKGRKNLLLNEEYFRKFGVNKLTGQFEVAKPVCNFPAGKKMGVLLLHGFSASPQEFRFLIPLLKEKGIPFYAPKLTGFGVNDLTQLQTIRGSVWVRDAVNAYDLLRQNVDAISIVGHSMGGLLGVLVAQQREVKQLILSAPYLIENKNHASKKKLLQFPGMFCLMSLFLPVVKKSTVETNSDRLVYHSVPLNAIKALWELHKFLNFALLKLHLSLLAGKLDNTSNMQLNEAILSKNGISFTTYEFEKSGHNILEDIEKEKVAKRVVDLLSI